MKKETSKRLSFGQILRNRRIIKGYSLRKLSSMLGGVVSHEMLSRYEKDAAEPRAEVKEKLCTMLEINENETYSALVTPPDVKFRRSRWSIPQKDIEAAQLLALELCNHY
ncbi:MAG: helix-turn-helix transcriptional regulator, partial [Bacteroidaceae bacterium]|nr:helix-turn-helix transcriptional regulator [Bacteroidaceae bacterium]